MKTLPLGRQYALVHSYEKSASYEAVARQHNVFSRTVQKYFKLHHTHGSLPLKHSRNRKSLVSKEAARVAAERLLSGEHGNSEQVAQELHRRGLTQRILDRTTIVRHAKAAAKEEGYEIKAETGKPKNGITAINKDARLGFSIVNEKRCWDNVLITDRKKFAFRHPGVKVRRVRWAKKGEHAAVYTVNCPQVVNVYAGVTKFGVTKLHIVAGTSKYNSRHKNKKGQPAKNITASEYREVVQKTLLPEGNRICSAEGFSSRVLQQDNDPTHSTTKAAIANYNGKHTTQVSLLPNWPANSPDLSPIENLWAIVEGRVDAAGCKTFEEFKQTLIAQWDQVSKKLCKKLMNSMEGRLQQCIAQQGGRINK